MADPAIREGLRQAWEDSLPGTAGAHEEGGFVLRDEKGRLGIARWPVGQQNEITLPPHGGCRFAGQDIVGTFHTHPNRGAGFLQEPSPTDVRAVRDDANLKGPDYEGEFVVSHEWIYQIRPSGRVDVVGRTSDLLARQS